jgi:hypothetical protein
VFDLSKARRTHNSSTNQLTRQLGKRYETGMICFRPFADFRWLLLPGVRRTITIACFGTLAFLALRLLVLIEPSEIIRLSPILQLLFTSALMVGAIFEATLIITMIFFWFSFDPKETIGHTLCLAGLMIPLFAVGYCLWVYRRHPGPPAADAPHPIAVVT